MKSIITIAILTLTTSAFASFGSVLPSIDWDLQDAGKEIRAAKASQAVLAAQNTMPSLFGGDTSASWRGFSYYKVESAASGCNWLVQVNDDMKVAGKKNQINCH